MTPRTRRVPAAGAAEGGVGGLGAGDAAGASSWHWLWQRRPGGRVSVLGEMADAGTRCL